jgi:MYXO-CTERM domain-containing protein
MAMPVGSYATDAMGGAVITTGETPLGVEPQPGSTHSEGLNMKRAVFTAFTAVILAFAVVLAFGDVSVAQSEPYAISTDGGTLVRLKPQGWVNATKLIESGLLTDEDLVPDVWEAKVPPGGSTSVINVTKYEPGYRLQVNGGADFNAHYGTPLVGNETFKWIQVVDSNILIDNATEAPHLDNLCGTCDSTKPFYPPDMKLADVEFRDFSNRQPTDVKETGDDPPVVTPVTWDAELYPVIVDGVGSVTVRDGVSWGWTMTKAMVGSTTGTFDNPTPDTAVTAVVNGDDESAFFWGESEDPSSMTFVGEAFHAGPGLSFTLGRLTFHNGVINTGTGADGIDFNAAIHLDNVPEEDFPHTTLFTIDNKPNIPTEDDPECCADILSIGDFEHPGASFTFETPEGSTESVDILGMLKTIDENGDVIDPLPSGDPFPSGAYPFDPGPFDPTVHYTLRIVGFSSPSPGGTIGYLPEPSTITLNALGLVALVLFGRRRRSRRGSA